MKTVGLNDTNESNSNRPVVPALLTEVADHPFLRGLSSEHLQLLADCAMKCRFEAGELIFQEGEPANRFYLLVTGKVMIESATEGKPEMIQALGAGDVLGWSWLIPPYYWHFDARAVEPTTAIFFYGTRLREVCEQDHGFAYQLMKRIARVIIARLQATRAQLLAKKGLKIPPNL
jgi:CRP-like cAMP-binding protein